MNNTSKSVKDYIERINNTYSKLDAILVETPDIQYLAKHIQQLLVELDQAKRGLAKLGRGSTDIRLLANHEYPSIQDTQFNIASLTQQYEGIYDINTIADKLYKLYAFPGQQAHVTESMTDKVIAESVWKLTPIQKLLRNVMSVDTPYRGLLVVHGTGVGKTCTAVSIAENLKEYVKGNEKKIYVIRDREFKLEMFDVNMVSKGTPGLQCTGETYLDAIKKSNPRAKDFILGCEQGHKDDCTRVDKLVRRQIDKFYEFSSPEIWAKRVYKFLESKTKHLTGVEKQQKYVHLIRTKFNNSILIIDEAHNLRNISANKSKVKKGVKLAVDGQSGEDEEEDIQEVKFVISILMKVLLYSQNMRLILLTATPMYDKSTDIVPLINFLLANDKRPAITAQELFDTDANLKAEAKLLEVTRGYISYIRGNDPMDFPIRLDASVNLDKHDLVNLDDYPRKDIFGDPVKETVKHLKLVSCPMSPEHQSVLLAQVSGNSHQAKTSQLSSSSSSSNSKSSIAPLENKEVELDKLADNSIPAEYINDSDRQFTVAYNTELQMSNFIYRTLDETNGIADQCYGKRGLNAVAKRATKQSPYTFKEEDYALRLKGDELKKYGPKFWKCLQTILNSTAQGPVFIYTRFTPGGVIPMAFILELAGFTRYNNERELLSSKHKATVNRGEYIIFTGDPLLSRGATQYFNLGKKMVDNKKVKVVIASEVGSEGLNLYGFREVHILDPWHNINLTEQTIGRVIRYKSHAHIKNPAMRNVTVYMYATVLTGKYKIRESIDLHTYAIAESKAFKSGKVEHVLKSGAIDCSITKPLNYRPRALYDKKAVMLVTSMDKTIPYYMYDMPYSKNALYMKDSNYECVLPTNNSKLPVTSVALGYTINRHPTVTSVPGHGVNNPVSTVFKSNNISKYAIEIRELIGSIQAILRENLNLLETDMLTLIKDTFQKSLTDQDLIQEIYKYLIEYFEVSDIVVLDKFGRSSRIVVVPVRNMKQIDITDTPDDDMGLNRNITTTGILRLIPVSYFDLKQPVPTQALSFLGALDIGTKLDKLNRKRGVEQISLTPYITTLKKEKLKLLSKEELDYNTIFAKMQDNINQILTTNSKKQVIGPAETELDNSGFETNLPITTTMGALELYKAVFDRLLYIEKLFLVQNIVYKLKGRDVLSSDETILFSVIKYLLVHNHEIFKAGESGSSIYTEDFIKRPDQLYGFILAEFNKLNLFRWDDAVEKTGDIKQCFVEDKTKLTTLLSKRKQLLESQTNNKLFGFLTYTKNTTLPPIFKITDYLTRGEKKSVKGVACNSKQVPDIINYINTLDSQHKLIPFKNIKHSRKLVCGDLEIIFRMLNNSQVSSSATTSNAKWWSAGYVHYFFSPEEYAIWQLFH